MQTSIDAIYENGVFRPLAKLDLPEGSQVRLIVEQSDGRADRPMPDWPRFTPPDLHLADPTVDRAEILAILAKIPGSVVDELREERRGRIG